MCIRDSAHSMYLIPEDVADRPREYRPVVIRGVVKLQYLSGYGMQRDCLLYTSKTIATMGCTVNTIQDKWPDEFLGLLAAGMRIGQFTRFTLSLIHI